MSKLSTLSALIKVFAANAAYSLLPRGEPQQSLDRERKPPAADPTLPDSVVWRTEGNMSACYARDPRTGMATGDPLKKVKIEIV